jgi:hypothetical protein
MAKFGLGSFGVGSFGVLEPVQNGLLWLVQVDWDDDGTFGGWNEALWATAVSWKRGRQHYIQSKGGGFEVMAPGEMYVTLRNDGGRFDAYNTSSLLYPDVSPEHLVQVLVKSDDSGSAVAVFTGILGDIQDAGSVDDPKVRLTIHDGWAYLQDADAYVALQESVDTDAAIGAVLSSISWPTIWGSSLESGADRIPFFWCEDKADAVLNELAESEMGIFFLAADGTAKYHNRHHTASAVATLESMDIQKDVKVSQPWETKRNTIKVLVHPRESETLAVLWQLRDTPVIHAGSSLELWAEFKDSAGSVCPAMNVVCESVTDWTMNTASDGTGADLTANCTISLTPYGKTARLVVTNNSPSDGYPIMQVRGNAVATLDAVLILKHTADKRQRILEIDLDWQQSVNNGTAMAAFLNDFLSTAQKNPVIRLLDHADQFTMDIGDYVDLSVTGKGISNVAYRVGGIDGEWLDESGEDVLITLYLETIPDISGYAIVGTSTVGGSDIVGY